jgi:hypothetical protein
MPDQNRSGDSENKSADHSGSNPGSAQRAPIEPLEGCVASAVKIEKTETRGIGAQERPEQASISNQTLVDRIDRSDRWMIALTAVIAVGGAISAFLFWKHLQAFEGQLAVMSGQLEEMKSSGRQTDELIAANKRTADVARDQLTLAYPPKLRVGSIYLCKVQTEPAKTACIEPEGLVPGERLEGFAFAINSGRESAKIERSDAFFYWHKEPLPRLRPTFEQNRAPETRRQFVRLQKGGTLTTKIIAPGESVSPGEVVGWHLTDDSGEHVIKVPEDGRLLWVIGDVRFQDRVGTYRSTFFARKYNPALRRFEAIQDDDYEGQD